MLYSSRGSRSKDDQHSLFLPKLHRFRCVGKCVLIVGIAMNKQVGAVKWEDPSVGLRAVHEPRDSSWCNRFLIWP